MSVIKEAITANRIDLAAYALALAILKTLSGGPDDIQEYQKQEQGTVLNRQ